MVAAPMPANRSETAPPRSENVAELSVVPGQATDAARIFSTHRYRPRARLLLRGPKDVARFRIDQVHAPTR